MSMSTARRFQDSVLADILVHNLAGIQWSIGRVVSARTQQNLAVMLDTPTFDGRNLLFAAVRVADEANAASIAIVMLLLRSGASVDGRGGGPNRTVLHWCITRERWWMVSYLHQWGPNINDSILRGPTGDVESPISVVVNTLQRSTRFPSIPLVPGTRLDRLLEMGGELSNAQRAQVPAIYRGQLQVFWQWELLLVALRESIPSSPAATTTATAAIVQDPLSAACSRDELFCQWMCLLEAIRSVAFSTAASHGE